MYNFSEILKNIENSVNINKTNKLYTSFIFNINRIDFLSIINKLNSDYFYWNNFEKNTNFLAIGKTQIEITSNKKDLVSSNKVLEKIVDLIEFTYSNSGIPLVCGGIKFSNDSSELWNDFSEVDFFVPQILLVSIKNESFCVINTNLNELEDTKNLLRQIDISESNDITNKISGKLVNDESIENWSAKIDSALNKIAQHEITKVVISRKKEVKLTNSDLIDCKTNFLRLLGKNHKDCSIFGYKKNNSFFFGASPENFLSLHNNYLETDALAGSSQKSNGVLLMDDDLLDDKKNRDEHNQVLEYIINGLNSLTINLHYDKIPKVKNFKYIQHLWTPINAVLKKGKTVLDIINSIFPTPAVCGYPKEKSFNIINEIEQEDRGMYSGLVGWFNLAGDAEFYVALRSALLKNCTLTAYAGCGIVDGSDSVKEFYETENKFTPIIDLIKIEH